MLRILLSSNILFLNTLLFSQGSLSQSVEHPSEWHELISDSGWTFIKEKDGIRVFEKHILASSVPAFRVALNTQVLAEDLLDIVWEVEKYPLTLPSAYTTKAGYGSIRDEKRQEGWQVVDVPFLAPRLYRFEQHRHPTRIDWISANFEVKEEMPRNTVIPPVNFGSWEVVEFEDRNVLVYRVCTDPGGLIPSMIVKKASRNYLPGMLMELEQAAKKR